MIVIDWEFTWLDHLKHSIVSLWAVDFLNPTNQFYAECRIWEWATWEDDALKINWFSVEQINDKSKMSLKELVILFDNWLKTCSKPQILIWQNPKSDIDFLRSSYERYGFEYPLWHRSLDTHSIVFIRYIQLWKKIPIEKWNFKINLDQSLEFVWIKWWEPKPHNALTWAICEAEVISRTIYWKKLLEAFNSWAIPEYLK